MKNKGNQNAIFQSFLFNIAFLIIFGGIGLYYVFPAYADIKAQKEQLGDLVSNYTTLQTQGLSYSQFSTLHGSLGKERGLDKNVYLSNVLKEFNKEDYDIHFQNKSGGDYNTFLTKKVNDVREKKTNLENTGINESVKEILPYYTKDSSLSDDSLTDFKFINYMESLLDAFRLQSTDSLGIGNLYIVKSFEEGLGKKKTKVKQLEGKIYYGTLKLSLVGKKSHIIDFVHYIENVGKIGVIDSEVRVHQPSIQKTYLDEGGEEKVNNFTNIKRYFRGREDVYNNLVMDIKSIKFEKYLDSSDLPTPDGKTLVSFVKESQADEKYNLDVELRFYVKGLPTYRIEDFIKKLSVKYSQLSQAVKSAIQFTTKNKSELKNFKQISAINDLKKFNNYLLGIKKEITGLEEGLEKKENLGEMYNTALSYHGVFTTLSEELLNDIEALSEPLYKKYKPILESN